MTLIEEIKQHEAFSAHPYLDTENVLTIGYGLNLDDGISEQLAAKILEWTVEERKTTLSKIVPFWQKLSPARQEVFLNMAYNLGIPRFLNFRRMLTAAAAGNIESVCQEMKDSKWYKQVGRRADCLIEKYRKG